MTKLQSDSIDWALEHVEKYGDTDIFPVPFEFEAIRYKWNEIRAELATKDISAWIARSPRRYVTPKSKYGFRISTQLDPLDALFYLAITFELAPDIERARLDKAKRVALSYRFAPTKDGQFFDPTWNWNLFLAEAGKHANSHGVKFVVITDIADFYPRIYAHPLENALAACTAKVHHVEALKNLMKGWNDRKSYGIPVGPSPSRLLAELVIDDVDQALLAQGITFVRSIDDYRIFCSTELEAYRALAFLADALFRMHGLTLQQKKTSILPVDKFLEQHVTPFEERSISRIAGEYRSLLLGAGIDDPYGEVQLNNLPKEVLQKIQSLNLVGMLKDALKEAPEPDNATIRFVLRALTQLQDPSGASTVLKHNLDTYAVFTDVIRYILAVQNKFKSKKKEIGKWFLDLMENSVVGHLDFHKLWILQIFASSAEWNNEDSFVRLYNAASDPVGVKRELILAMGRANNRSWFKMNKQDFGNMSPWLRRAFIAGAACMPGDEATYWFKSVNRTLDPLERAVKDWVLTKL